MWNRVAGPCLLSAALALSSGCGVIGSDEKTMFIGPQTQACHTWMPIRCLMEAPTPQGPWRLFYEGIEGFTHEAGYLYELRVAVSDWPKTVQDVGDTRYVLVRVVSKTRVE
jgi:hypothetical protein